MVCRHSLPTGNGLESPKALHPFKFGNGKWADRVFTAEIGSPFAADPAPLDTEVVERWSSEVRVTNRRDIPARGRLYVSAAVLPRRRSLTPK
jgi:hypothetical protein